MKEIIINCEKLRSRRVLHDYLEEVLALPSYYGRNLDALRDHLANVNLMEAVIFRVVNCDLQSSRMHSLWQAFVDMLHDLHTTNPNVDVMVDPERYIEPRDTVDRREPTT